MKRLALLWVASLVLVAMGTLTFAQNRLPQPQMLSGNDIGFRVEQTDINGKAMGTWMVRFNGVWVEINPMAVRPLK